MAFNFQSFGDLKYQLYVTRNTKIYKLDNNNNTFYLSRGSIISEKYSRGFYFK